MTTLGTIMNILAFGLLNPLGRELSQFFTPSEHSVYKAIELVALIAGLVGGWYYCLLVNSLYQ